MVMSLSAGKFWGYCGQLNPKTFFRCLISGIVQEEHDPDELAAAMGRGPIALPTEENRVFVGWRLLFNNPKRISFNVDRKELGKKRSTSEILREHGENVLD